MQSVTSSCFLNNPYSFADNRYICIYFFFFWPGNLLYVSVPRQTDSCARILHLGPKTMDFFVLYVFLAYAKATSEAYLSK